MNGIVDSFGRALIRVKLRNPDTGASLDINAWIDTGFTSELVVPRQQIAMLALPEGPSVTATIADGSEIQFVTYSSQMEWFDEWKSVEVVANDGQFPLLGVGLLMRRRLHIDYEQKTLSIN